MPQVPKILRLLDPADRAELDRLLRERRLTYAEILAWLAARGCQTTHFSLRSYAHREGLRKPRPHAMLRIDRELSAADRTAYEALLADPATTIDVAAAWLAARGHSFTRKTIGIHRVRFMETIVTVRHTARLAAAITDLARARGDAAMSDGMLTRFEQVMLEQLTLPRADGSQIPARDLADISKSVAAAVGSREQFEAMRRELEAAKRQAVEGAERAARGGATGPEVVERVREILGV